MSATPWKDLTDKMEGTELASETWLMLEGTARTLASIMKSHNLAVVFLDGSKESFGRVKAVYDAMEALLDHGIAKTSGEATK